MLASVGSLLQWRVYGSTALAFAFANRVELPVELPPTRTWLTELHISWYSWVFADGTSRE